MRWVNFYPDVSTFLQGVQTQVDFSTADLSCSNPFDECIKFIKKIANTYPAPYTLLVSGGIDSQAMLLAWKNSGIRFRSVFYKYNQNFNEHDLVWLKEFSSINNLIIDYNDIDIFNVLKTEHPKYVKLYISNSPIMNCYIKMADLIKDGTVITSGSPPTLEGLSLNYSMLALERYRRAENKNYIPFFFQEDPRVAGAFINKALEIRTHQICRHLQGYGYKTYHYYASGFNVLPSYKISGFEQYKALYDNFKYNIPKFVNLKFAKYPSSRTFDYLFRYPNFDINRYIDDLRYYFKQGNGVNE